MDNKKKCLSKSNLNTDTTTPKSASVSEEIIIDKEDSTSSKLNSLIPDVYNSGFSCDSSSNSKATPTVENDNDYINISNNLLLELLKSKGNEIAAAAAPPFHPYQRSCCCCNRNNDDIQQKVNFNIYDSILESLSLISLINDSPANLSSTLSTEENKELSDFLKS